MDGGSESEGDNGMDGIDDELASAALHGVSTDGVQATVDYMNGDNDDDNNEQQQQLPPQREQFKVTAKVAAQGRQIMMDKLEEEDMMKKQALLTKISQYHNAFPFLKESCPIKKPSTKQSLKWLIEEVSRCKSELDNKNAYETIKHLDIILNWAVEKTSINWFGIPAQGLSKVAKESQELVEQELRELSVKYADRLATGPEYRYGMKFLSRLSAVIDANKNMHGFGNAQEEDMSPDQQKEMNDKYKDML